MNDKTNTVSIINLVLLVVILILGLMGKFAAPTSMDMDDVKDVVADAMDDKDTAPTAAQPTQPTQPAAASTIDLDELESFYEESYVLGSPDAKVTVLEFSDFQCPYCKRHSTQGTLEQVMEKYGDDVNVVFTHFPLSFHPLAQKAQEASECIAEQGGSDAYYAFKKAIFNEADPSRANIDKVAATLDGIDVEEMNTCIDAGTYAQKVTDAMNFGRKLGVTGTPGNIVMDNETGEYTKVSGAVPASAFDAAISSYLN